MKFFLATVSLVVLLGEAQLDGGGQQFVDSRQAQARAGPNAQQLCKNNKRSYFAHEDYCDYFYECVNGEAIVQTCPNGLAFAGYQKGLANHCDYPHRVGCPDGTRVMGQQPISSENCHWQYGVFPHTTSCTRYWHCWNGTATIQQCPFSLLYNDAVHACDWPDNVPDCQKHPICKDTPNGAVPIEKSCVRYWLCVGGYPRLQRCPAGLALNTSTFKCELASTVPGCEPPPTTPSPDDDEEQPVKPQSESSGTNSRPQQSSNTGLPQQFRPQQSGVRLVG